VTVAGITDADGSLYRSANVSWTFPASFESGTTPAVRTSSNSGTSEWGSGAVSSHTSGSARLYRATSEPLNREMSLLAVGRWF